MDFFTDKFVKYEDCAPPGVRLPKTNIDDKYYKELDIPKDTSNFDFLRKLCHKGVKDRKIDQLSNKDEYFQRAKAELSILEDLGFTDYILLNWDILNYCHENDIPTGPGRGSAAGSLVLYLIGVTNIDPVKHDLFFERFVSKSRAKKTEKDGVTYLDGSLLADVDNDISYERRKEVIDYIERKHPGRTCKILTLNTLSGKLCIKECGKIVGEYSEQEVNRVSDLIPKHFGKVAPLKTAIVESEAFAEWAVKNKKVFNIARKLEGLNKNTGVHPSGIAISHDKLTDICPVQLTNEGALVTGYDMNWVSELMVKFDILGLRTLSVIHDVCKRLGLDMSNMDFLDKEETYKNLNNLKTPHGLFQIEADANFKVCRKINPKNLEELSAVIAIGRPGALDFLDDYASYVRTGEFQSVHEFYDDVLSYTGGLPLYQEQLMKMAVKVGFSLDESEQLRRIVGKKKVDKMPEWKEKISKKIEENNLDPEIGDVLWKVAEDSANYSFNKSHSIAYASLAAWTAYLKFKYPQDFFLSLLKMTKYEPSPQEEIRKVCQDLPHFNILLKSPDLVKSKMDFSKEDSDIRFGLNSIKGVSEKSLQSLRNFRESDTPTKYDIFLSAKQAGLNIGILSALIQAGALSEFKSRRPRLVLEAQAFNLLTDREKRNFIALGPKFDHDILKSIEAAVKENLPGDDNRALMSESRFNTFKKKYLPYKEIYDKNKRYEKFANWYFETQLLGYSYSISLKETFSLDFGDLMDANDYYNMAVGERGKFIAVVEDSMKRVSRNGNQYIRLFLNDEVGRYSAMLADNRRNPSCKKYLDKGGKVPQKGSIVMVYGSKGEDIVFANELSIVDEKIYMKLSDLK
tara:strand:+ start:740 stop:3304 length:2565 start_codon:yes stop_codon:yes gene_type:complete